VALAKFDAARKRVNTGKHGRQIETLVASTTAIKTTGEDTNTMLKEAMPILRKMDDLLFGKPRTRDEVTGTDKEILKEASDLRIGQRLRQERLNVIRPLAQNIQNTQAAGGKPRAINSIKVKIGRASRKIENLTDSSTLTQVKERLRAIIGVPAEHRIDLNLGDGRWSVDDGRSLSDAGVTLGSTIEAVIVEPLTRINVKPHAKDPITLEAKATDTIADVKAKVQETAGTPVDRQILKFGRVTLEDSSTLSDYHIQHNASISLAMAKAKAKGKAKHGINAGDVD
jgi:hypothetical protein